MTVNPIFLLQRSSSNSEDGDNNFLCCKIKSLNILDVWSIKIISTKENNTLVIDIRRKPSIFVHWSVQPLKKKDERQEDCLEDTFGWEIFYPQNSLYRSG